jgi:phage terminase large subunit-like protein
MEQRTVYEQERLTEWIKRGYLIGVPGPVIDPRYIANEIGALAGKYHIRILRFDRYRSEGFKVALDAVGANLPLLAHGQGYASMSPCVSNFYALALAGKIRHGNNPVLNAAVCQAVIDQDPSGNLKPSKGRSGKTSTIRIDPAVALLMAIGDGKQLEPERTFDLIWI